MVEFNQKPNPSDVFLGAPYKKVHNPWVLNSPEVDSLRDGINCQTFAHLYYKFEFGVSLPVGMWSKEFYEDQGHFFYAIGADAQYVRGDIFLFGKHETRPENFHVAVAHRISDVPDDFILRHANQEDGMVSDWSLRKMNAHARYPVLHGVRRMIPDLFSIAVQPFLRYE